MDVFFWFATIGTLALLTMYALTNVAALCFLARGGARGELLLPLAGLAVAGYVLYHHLWPVPPSPYDVFPYLVAGWLVVGVVLAQLRKAGSSASTAADPSNGTAVARDSRTDASIWRT